MAAANKNAGTVAAKKDNISDKSEYADGSDEVSELLDMSV